MKRRSWLDVFRRKRREATAALDSTAINARTADYYRDAINESAAQVFDVTTRMEAQARGQLEYLNDPLFFGACQKIAALVCGSGTALKIEGPIKEYEGADVPDRGEKAQYLERAFKRFADALDLLGMMRLIQTELLFHGEVFVRKIRSAQTIERYTYVFIRPDRVVNPPGVGTDPYVNDGILYDTDDDAAEPVGYYIQKEKVNPLTQVVEYELIPAGEIIHIFNRILPQQRRGVPEVQTALGIIREIKQLRRLEIQAVKNAAKTSVILTTDAEPILDAAYSGDEITVPAPGATGSELPDGVFIARPGYTPIFGDSKHPATGFLDFKKALAADVGAALGVGSGKINNNHADYNFSSAKMDEQHDAVIVAVRQKKIASSFLDVVFNDWIAEFSERDAVAAEFLDAAGAPEMIARRWLFPSPRSIDRLKDAQADAVELENNTITLEEIAARRGLDLEELLIERAREIRQIEEIGGGSVERIKKERTEIVDDEDTENQN
ncbi:MAG: phage portal protein [Thermoguttaceae bacterium]|nr:phage portal protein [Thermoguttaceae bacterium]